jgi:imidazolonepropionase-like amidohydrolase
MKQFFFISSLIISINIFAQKNNYDLIINNINVINVNTGKVTPATNVYIKNGVVEITTQLIKTTTPKKQIDGTGKYFMPALYDMHVHFPEKNAERFFQLQTAAGITHCRIMKSASETVSFSKKAKNSPAMKIAYNFFGNETYSADSAFAIINSLKQNGYDFIKIFGVKDIVQFYTIMAAAKANKLIVCGHALGKVAAQTLLTTGYKSIEHVGYFDNANLSSEALDSLIDLSVKNNVFVCPTLDWLTMGYQAANKDSFVYRTGYAIGTKLYGADWDTTYTNNTKQFGGQEKQYKDYADNSLAIKLKVLAKMRAKGVKIIAGSDAEEPYQTPGFSLIDELKLIQKAGFTNAELLQMVTTNAKEFYVQSIPNSKTKIAERTDYILLSKNPLQNIANLESVEYVIKGSEVINTKQLLQTIK